MLSSFSCEECEDLLPGYVLDALEPDETARVEVHVESCDRCQASLKAYEATLDRLAEAVPLQDPPAHLRRRLMADIASAVAPLATSQGLLPRWWQVGRPMLPTLVTAMLLLGVGWLAWQVWYGPAWEHERWRITAQRLDLQYEALALLAAPNSRRALLRADAGEARGVLLIQATTSHAMLMVQDLPPLPSNRVYQLWLIRNGRRDNGGIFQVDERGYGMLEVNAPQTLKTYQAVGITEEPAGGSPGPTSRRLLGARLTSQE